MLSLLPNRTSTQPSKFTTDCPLFKHSCSNTFINLSQSTNWILEAISPNSALEKADVWNCEIWYDGSVISGEITACCGSTKVTKSQYLVLIPSKTFATFTTIPHFSRR